MVRGGWHSTIFIYEVGRPMWKVFFWDAQNLSNWKVHIRFPSANEWWAYKKRLWMYVSSFLRAKISTAAPKTNYQETYFRATYHGDEGEKERQSQADDHFQPRRHARHRPHCHEWGNRRALIQDYCLKTVPQFLDRDHLRDVEPNAPVYWNNIPIAQNYHKSAYWKITNKIKINEMNQFSKKNISMTNCTSHLCQNACSVMIRMAGLSF